MCQQCVFVGSVDVGDFVQGVGYGLFGVLCVMCVDGLVMCFIVQVLDEIQYWVVYVQGKGVVVGVVEFFFVVVVVLIFGDVDYWDVFDVQFGYDFMYCVDLICVVVDQQQVGLCVGLVVGIFFQQMLEVVGQYFFYYVEIVVWCDFGVFDVEFVILVFDLVFGIGDDYVVDRCCVLNVVVVIDFDVLWWVGQIEGFGQIFQQLDLCCIF